MLAGCELTEPLEVGVILEAGSERDGVLHAKSRVVQVEEFEVYVVVKGVAEPDGLGVAEMFEMEQACASRDVFLVKLLFSALFSNGGIEHRVVVHYTLANREKRRDRQQHEPYCSSGSDRHC